jgi:hypothetical protein
MDYLRELYSCTIIYNLNSDVRMIILEAVESSLSLHMYDKLYSPRITVTQSLSPACTASTNLHETRNVTSHT